MSINFSLQLLARLVLKIKSCVMLKVFKLFLTFVFIALNTLSLAQESRKDLFLSHANDADIIGGNDEGLTFCNSIFYTQKDQDPNNLASQIFSCELTNSFFSQKRLIDNAYYLRDEQGRIYLDYFEKIELKLSKQFFEDPNESRSWLVGANIHYEHSNPSETGSELQNDVHSWVGFEANPTTQRVYNYTDNQVELNRGGITASCQREWKFFYTPHITHQIRAGLEADSTDIEQSCVTANTEIQFHTESESVFKRDRPKLMAFANVGCKQYFDINNTESVCTVGLQSSVEVSERQKLFCRLEWIQPLSHNEELNQGFVDLDPMLKLSLGFTW
jgi:hypothetical protein